MGAPKSFVEVIASGDQRASLEALRDKLASRIEAAEPRETAALAKQLADVIARIETLPVKEKSTLDDLADRRSRRLSKTPKRAGSGVKRRSGSG